MHGQGTTPAESPFSRTSCRTPHPQKFPKFRKFTLPQLRSLGVQDLPTLRLRPGEAPRASPLALTAREMEVLCLLIVGHSNHEIGEALYISPAAAARHVANLCTKLGVDSRAEATAHALQHGLA